MKADDAIDELWKVVSHPVVPEYEKKRLIKVIHFIESQERALDAKHEALTAFARKITTQSGQNETSGVSARGFEN